MKWILRTALEWRPVFPNRVVGRVQRASQARRTAHCALVALLVVPQGMTPAVITVDGTDSTVAVDGVCSLREAINNANSDSDTTGGDCVAGSGADAVSLTTDVTLTLLDHGGFFGEGFGLPAITTDVTVDGSNFSIARDGGAPEFSIFEVRSNGTLNLESTTVSGGYDRDGGAIYMTGGTATLTNSTLSDNGAEVSGGAIDVNSGTLTLINSTLSDNYAGFGGGLSINDYTDVTLINSTLSDNYARLFGGGIDSEGNPTLINSTLSGNSAGLSGGGVHSYLSFLGGTVTLINSTLSANTAPNGGSLYRGSYNSAVSSHVRGTNTVTNSIIVGGDCFGAFSDGGGNFTDAMGCVGDAFVDGVDIDTALADNGGPTETHALLPGSLAVDAAGSCGLATDQRGALRDDGSCDSGSYEFKELLDIDGDGVVDGQDLCPATVAPEKTVPEVELGLRRAALLDNDFFFDFGTPSEPVSSTVSTTETAGCSCEQILDALDIGDGPNRQFGCSISVVRAWVDQLLEKNR